MKKPELAIEVKNLSKKFIIPKYNRNSLKEIIVHGWLKNEKTEKQVLNNINFTINKGDFFGIVGRNGSGKSTLLKLIAGVYTPDSGEIKLHGKLTPFIELGAGFNPDLSGRDNVFLNGALLGFTRKQMETMYDEIVDFAELHEFMDLKLKNYSSGMQVRLAFSIAIKSRSDILVLDEVLAVGDAAFQEKCLRQFNKLKKEGRTVVLVTHDMHTVEKFCNRVVVIHDGAKLYEGDYGGAIDCYNELNLVGLSSSATKDELLTRKTSEILIEDISVVDDQQKPVKVIKSRTNFSFKVSIRSKKNIKDGFLVVKVFDSEHQMLIFEVPNDEVKITKGLNTFLIDVRDCALTSGNYYIVGGLYDSVKRNTNYSHFNSLQQNKLFMVKRDSNEKLEGIIEPNIKWRRA